MERVICRAVLAVIAVMTTLMTYATTAPKAFLVGGEASNWVGIISDNGRWGLSETPGAQDVDNPMPTGGKLVDLESGAITPIAAGPATGISSVGDVTDDGRTVVGMADFKPAIWSRESGKWTKLGLPASYDMGMLTFVTPDGRRAVGYAGRTADINVAHTILYDLEAGAYVELPNMPYIGMTGLNYAQNAPYGISADGRYIFGLVAPSYYMDMFLPVMWAYVYDTSNDTFKPIGWTVDSSWKFKPLNEGQNFINSVRVSPSGEWLTGAIRMAKPLPGSEFMNDYVVPYRYNVATEVFEILDNEEDHDTAGFAIDDSGVVYGATPWEYPYPEAVVRHGRYFYQYSKIFSQVYGFSLQAAINDDTTGRPVSVSSDGLVQAMVNGDGLGYILRLSEPIGTAAEQIDLLGSYAAQPPAGSVMSKIKSVQITFDRSIAFNGDYSRIQVLGPDGAPFLTALQSTSVLTSNDHVLSVGLRTATMAKDATYTLVIPAGVLSIKGDPSVKNREIRINYTGRGSDAVAVRSIYPPDGSSLARLDSSSNPIVLTYDCEIQLAEGVGDACLYEGSYRDPKARLLPYVNGRTLYLFPSATAYLFSGTDYTVTIPQGFVTDLSGTGASQAVTLNYHGIYVREVNSDETYLFRADGSQDSYLQFIVFDGDQLTPAETPEAWGFTPNTGWFGVLSSESSDDLAFASHSMYKPAGQSDDWMMTPQLYIPEKNVRLSFDVQGYLKSKQDRLKVYVYASEDGYNSLTPELAAEIRAKGTLLHDEVASPGALEENLDGEWTHHTYSLDPWAGKSVYIAFVNDNRDQSAVFVDNVEVMRDINYVASFKHPASVVGRDDISIEGSITITSETQTFNDLTMTLADAEGRTVDTFSASGLGLKRGQSVPFAFAKPLPLTVGRENPFTVSIDFDGVKTQIKDNIRDLVFEPVKRVVLEEFTGSECGNCPLGILAIERLKELYPNNFIPITLRCYKGDMLGAGVTAYANYLGLNAAPSGLINRNPDVLYPCYSVGNDYFFSGSGIKQPDGSEPVLWFDAVASELQTPADADIAFDVNFDAASRTLTIPCRVRFALETKQKAVRLFAVILEDRLETYQMNYLNGIECEALLPWSKGGALGVGATLYTFDDVARGAIGQTYAGTGGLIPTDIEAARTYTATLSGQLPTSVTDENVGNVKVVVMMIDELTGLVINANIAPLGGSTDGVSDVLADATESIAIVRGHDFVTAVAADSVPVQLTLCSLDGRILARADGTGSATAELRGYRGLVIARAATPGASTTAKLLAR